MIQTDMFSVFHLKQEHHLLCYDNYLPTMYLECYCKIILESLFSVVNYLPLTLCHKADFARVTGSQGAAITYLQFLEFDSRQTFNHCSYWNDTLMQCASIIIEDLQRIALYLLSWSCSYGPVKETPD